MEATYYHRLERIIRLFWLFWLKKLTYHQSKSEIRVIHTKRMLRETIQFHTFVNEYVNIIILITICPLNNILIKCYFLLKIVFSYERGIQCTYFTFDIYRGRLIIAISIYQMEMVIIHFSNFLFHFV